MRPNTSTMFKTKSNVDADSVKMSFDENSLGFLMDVMTNLYEDPTGAPLREYSSNARDSHIDAGKADVPIEVTLPTQFNRTFKVQDFGLGMSVDDLFNVYSKYGYSTKRESNLATGMLGLGSKSGLTYTDQFTVTAVKDGVKTMAVVTRGEDGAGSIKIMDTSQTDECNGVTVSIPVHNVDVFRSKARNFFRWWTPGTVLVDGEEPEPVSEDPLEIDGDIFIHKQHVITEDYVVMGEVAYPVGNRLSQGLPWGYRVAAYVPMGAVNFPPNREGLQYTKRTEDVLKDIARRRDEGIRKAAEADIVNAATYTDALRASMTWGELLRNSRPEYKGERIPMQIEHSEGFFYFDFDQYRNRLIPTKRITDRNFVNSVLIKDFTNVNLSVQNRQKIKAYFEQEGIDETKFIASENPVGDKWGDDLTVVSWDDIKTIRLNSGGVTRNRAPSQMFDIFDVNGPKRVHRDDIDDSDIILVSPADMNTSKRYFITRQDLTTLFPKATFVLLATNRWDKFKREVENVRGLGEAVADYRKVFEKSLNDFQYTELAMGVYQMDVFKHLDDSKVDDPELKAIVRQVNNSVSRRTEYNSLTKVERTALARTPSLPSRDDKFQDMLDRYPFLQYASRRADMDHMHDYINLFYEKENK